MSQTTISDEGCYTYQNRVAANNNFTELYADKLVSAGTSSAVTNSGLSTVDSSVATSFPLSAPAAGVHKYLHCTGATANVTVSCTAAGVTIGAVGSSLAKVVFTAADQVIHLMGETTAKWVKVSQNSTAITVTT